MGRKLNLNKDNIINLYLKGKSLELIAEKYNCSTKPIKKILIENNYYKLKFKRDLTTEEIKSILCDYKNIISIIELNQADDIYLFEC